MVDRRLREAAPQLAQLGHEPLRLRAPVLLVERRERLVAVQGEVQTDGLVAKRLLTINNQQAFRACT